MRIYLYSHNTRGLGHAARNAAIAHGIFEIDPKTSILSVTGASAQISELLPKNADYVKLPSFDGIEKNGELVIVPQRLQISKKELIKLRASIIEASALSFAPDAVIVDFSPMGKGGELVRMLERVKSELPKTRVYLGIRDIIGQLPDNSVVYDDEVVEFINQHYQAIFYYGDPQVILHESDPFTLTHSTRLNIPVIPTGYVTRQTTVDITRSNEIRNRYTNLGDFLVVASAGGGKHSLDFFQAVIHACRSFSKINNQTLRLLLITGPYFTAEDQVAIEAQIQNDDWVISLKFVPNVIDYIGAADLFIGTGGYNTMVETMVAKKPSIIIARCQVDSAEQAMRANLFQDFGISESVLWDENMVKNIQDRITKLVGSTSPQATRHLDLAGKTRVAEMILNSFER